MTPPRSRGITAATELAIRSVVEEKMRNQECFFALDVTNEVKDRGMKTTPLSNFGSHRDMAPVVQDHARAIAASHGYSWASIDVGDGTQQAYLYFPNGTTTAALQAHVNRRVTPAIPVDVRAAQISQQATGSQAQAVAAPKADPMDQLQQKVMPGKATFGGHLLRLITGK